MVGRLSVRLLELAAQAKSSCSREREGEDVERDECGRCVHKGGLAIDHGERSERDSRHAVTLLTLRALGGLRVE